MNKEKLLELAEIIENAKPESFHMGAWFGKKIEAQDSDRWDELSDSEMFRHDDEIVTVVEQLHLAKLVPLDSDKLKISCQTTACIAGWAIANEYFKAKDPVMKNQFESMGLGQMDAKAREILDLTVYEASRLFYCDEGSIWDQVRDDYKFGNSLHTDYQELWDIPNKEAAIVLRKIANGEYVLDNEYEEED